jgi:hypothetical protein
MKLSQLAFAAITSIALAPTSPVLAQDGHDNHDHTSAAQPSQTAGPTSCPMATRGLDAAGTGQMSQGTMGGQQMATMMQQMHTEIQQMHKEMMQMRMEMRRRKAR